MNAKQYIDIKNLIPGMVVAEDVYDSANHLIVPAGTQVTDKLIIRLDFYSIKSILVISDEPIEVPEVTPSTYSERIKASADFQEFKRDFTETTAEIKDTLNNIITKNASPDNIQNILTSTERMLSTNNTNLHVFDMLHNMREMDDSTYVHSINVALIATVLGRWLKIPDEDLKILTTCGLLHDIGKLMVPVEILAKPGPLTPEEYEIIKTHTTKGYQMLKSMELDKRIYFAAMSHHERCDGSGYPLKLHSAHINPFAKIIAIADVYDAMTAARVYRGPVCPFKVISIFEKEGFDLYDPNYLLPFLKHVVDSYIHNTVMLSTGETGEIVMINRLRLSKPVVKCGDNYIDLSQQRHINIEAIL